MSEIISERASLENCYYYFVQAISVLSKSAERQYGLMGNYNVPYELKSDGLDVDCLLKQSLTEGARTKRMATVRPVWHIAPAQTMCIPPSRDKKSPNVWRAITSSRPGYC